MTSASQMGAQWLAARRRRAPFGEGPVPADLDEAYAVQDALLAASGQVHAGWKIALTNDKARAGCRSATPISGRLGREGLLAGPAALARSDYTRLGLEPELAVRIGEGGALSIDAVAAAFEVIDDRGADYAALTATALVCDNCWNRGVVLGPVQPVLDWPDLSVAALRLEVNGAVVGEAQGLSGDDPRALLGWLADHLQARGLALNAGDWVLTGSLLPPVYPEMGDTVRFDIAGLAPVELTVA